MSAHTIRIWERRYSILRPKRSATNIRAYSDDDLRKLLNVFVLSEQGMKISHIARLTTAEIEQRVLEISAEGRPVDEMESLVMAMADLDEQRFERTIGNALLRTGFEHVVEGLLVPFLTRVGVLWQAGKVRPGQEHFVSNLIRQKLIAAIDAIAPSPHVKTRTLLMALPEGEQHELGLLFCAYIAKKEGHRVIYLGQDVPLADVQAMVRRHHPDALITAFLTKTHPQTYFKQLRALRKALPRTPIVVHLGQNPHAGKLPAQVLVVQDLKAFRTFLS